MVLYVKMILYKNEKCRLFWVIVIKDLLMSDKKTGNGQDDSINEESQNYGLSNSDDTIFNDDFSDIDDSVSSEDFEQPVEEDFSGLNDVETGDVVEDYFNDEFDDPEESSLDTGKDDEEITSVDDSDSLSMIGSHAMKYPHQLISSR